MAFFRTQQGQSCPSLSFVPDIPQRSCQRRDKRIRKLHAQCPETHILEAEIYVPVNQLQPENLAQQRSTKPLQIQKSEHTYSESSPCSLSPKSRLQKQDGSLISSVLVVHGSYNLWSAFGSLFCDAPKYLLHLQQGYCTSKTHLNS